MFWKPIQHGCTSTQQTNGVGADRLRRQIVRSATSALLAFLLAIVVGLPSFVAAQEPTQEPGPATPPESSGAAAEKPAENGPAVNTPPDAPASTTETPPVLDDELLNDLAPESIDEQLDVDALEKAVDGMRTATDRLETGDLGDDTQSLQRKAVSELDRLIELIKKQQQRDNQQQQQQQQQQNQDQQQNEQDQQQQQQNQQQQNQQQQSKPQKQKKMSRLQKQLQQERQRQRQKQQQQQQRQPGGRMPRPQSPQPEPKPGGEESPQPQDSSAELRERKLQQEKEKQRQAINDVWGHLPPQVRQELQSLYSEKYLPKYDELVRRYYEALAARSRKQRPRPANP